MTDREKLEKVRAEIERRKKLHENSLINPIHEGFGLQNVIKAKIRELTYLHSFIDSMQEEPTTSVWHDTRSDEPIVGRNIVMLHYNHIYSGEYLGERFFGREKFTLMSDSKWAYFDDLIKL